MRAYGSDNPINPNLVGQLNFWELDLPKLITENIPMITGVIATLVSALIIYKLSARAIRAAIIRAKGTEGDVNMLLGLWRFLITLIVIVFLLGTFFPQFGVLGWAFGTFGGLFLGWALQPPVTGFAAWLLVTLKRPFRVGDRVQLPSFGLVGDVTEVGPMYTVLNQVGGSIGSEEAVGRLILVPNAMLFSNLVINYTPRETVEVEAPQSQKARESAYILDEVVVRITFDSDWDEAERILLNTAREVTADIIKATGQEPYIRSDMSDWYGVYMRLRFMTMATDRPRITHEISKRIFKEIKVNDKVDLAIPYIYSFKRGAQWAPPFSQEHLATLAELPRAPNWGQNPSSEGKIRCFHCAAENSVDAVYCNKCGKRLAQRFPAGKGR